MIESEFTLFQIQRELVRWNAVELREPPFRKAPEALDAVHVGFPSHEFILAMEDTVMVVAIEDEAVVGSPTVRMDGAAFKDFALDYGQELSPAAILHDRDVHLAGTFENAEHGRLSRRAAASFAADAASSEVRFINFHLAAELGFLDGVPSNLLPEEVVVPVYRLRIENEEGAGFDRGKILREAPQNLSDFECREFGVFERHRRILEEILLGKSLGHFSPEGSLKLLNIDGGMHGFHSKLSIEEERERG